MNSSDNYVAFAGRVSAPPETVVLPSGDHLVTFRLIVDRSPAAKRRSKQTVDTFECVAWTSALRRSLKRLEAGTQVAVEGELRRRWSRGATGPMSRVTVEVSAWHRVETTAVASSS